jgi:predicted rRNA methylase YqxC with S4 and FtsJ domains
MKVARADSAFASLRKTILFMKVDRLIYFRIDSYTDPVVSNLIVKNHSKIQELISSGKITKNDALSAFRSVAVMNQLKLELNVNASKYLSQEKAKKLIDQLNSSIEKSRVKIGNEVLRYRDFRI